MEQLSKLSITDFWRQLVHQASSNISDLYQGGAWLNSWLGPWLFWLRIFMVILNCSRQMLGHVLKIGHICFHILYNSSFTNHSNTSHYAFWATANVVKYTTNKINPLVCSSSHSQPSTSLSYVPIFPDFVHVLPWRWRGSTILRINSKYLPDISVSLPRTPYS
jgi:hypothetical protein